MPDYAWAKVFCELPRDPKLTIRPVSDRWLFTVLILLARESKEPAVIDAAHAAPSWLATYTGLRPSVVTAAVRYFQEQGMVSLLADGSLLLVHFPKRQDPTDPGAADRMARKRNKDRNVTRNTTVTEPVTLREQLRPPFAPPLDSPPISPQEDRGQRTEKDIESSVELSHPRRAGAVSEPEGFGEFWETYPKNHGSRKDAAICWRNLSMKDRAAALIGARHYGASGRVLEGGSRFTKAAESWLRARQWETWQEAETVVVAGSLPYSGQDLDDLRLMQERQR